MALARALKCLVIAAAVTLTPAASVAQTYPAKPIRLVVPFAPGGGQDALARLLSQHLSPKLGHPLVVENRPGSGGIIAAEFVAKSDADGYTLLSADVGANAIAVSLYPKLAYDPIKSFTPITLVMRQNLVMVVPASLEAKTVQDLVGMAKASRERLNYASAGSGGISHVAAEKFLAATNVQMVHVPYKGGGPGAIATVTGEVQMFITAVVAVKPLIDDGRLRALAVTSRERSPLLPGVPTMAEAGVSNFEVGAWSGVLAPANLPAPIANRLSHEINEVLKKPEVRERFVTLGFEAVGTTPAGFADFLRSEVAKWAVVIREAGIKAD